MGKNSAFWLCWGLTTHQPLWVILCLLSEKGRWEIEKEMKERNTGERGKWNRRKKKHSPSTLTSCKDRRHCPTVSPSQLDASVKKDTWHLCLTQPPYKKKIKISHYIYILNVTVYNKAGILVAVHFSMQNIELHNVHVSGELDCALGRGYASIHLSCSLVYTR